MPCRVGSLKCGGCGKQLHEVWGRGRPMLYQKPNESGRVQIARAVCGICNFSEESEERRTGREASDKDLIRAGLGHLIGGGA